MCVCVCGVCAWRAEEWSGNRCDKYLPTIYLHSIENCWNVMDADLRGVEVVEVVVVCVMCVCLCVDRSYTRLNYQAGECHSAMAGSHTADSELESHFSSQTH